MKCVLSPCWTPTASVTQNVLLWLIAAIFWFSTTYSLFIPTTQRGAPQGHPGCVQAAAPCPQLHLGAGTLVLSQVVNCQLQQFQLFITLTGMCHPQQSGITGSFPSFFPFCNRGLCLFFPSQPMPGWGFVLLSGDMMTNCKWIIRST